MQRELAAGDRIMERAVCAAPADASAIATPVSAPLRWVGGGVILIALLGTPPAGERS